MISARLECEYLAQKQIIQLILRKFERLYWVIFSLSDIYSKDTLSICSATIKQIIRNKLN